MTGVSFSVVNPVTCAYMVASGVFGMCHPLQLLLDVVAHRWAYALYMNTRQHVYIAARVLGICDEEETANASAVCAGPQRSLTPFVSVHPKPGKSLVRVNTEECAFEDYLVDKCFVAGTPNSHAFLDAIALQLVSNAKHGYNTCVVSYGKYDVASHSEEMDDLVKNFGTKLFDMLGESDNKTECTWQVQLCGLVSRITWCMAMVSACDPCPQAS